MGRSSVSLGLRAPYILVEVDSKSLSQSLRFSDLVSR